MEFEGFNWDFGNEVKCQKHGLTIKEIESFFLYRTIYVAPDVKHSIDEERFLAIGEGAGRKFIIVAFTFRNIKGKNYIRPISARFMNKREVQKYEKVFEKNENR